MFNGKSNKYNYANVRGWSKKVPGGDIFDLKYILCPYNYDNLHWTLAVIFMEEKRVQWYDSCGGTVKRILDGLIRYLKDKFFHKKGR